MHDFLCLEASLACRPKRPEREGHGQPLQRAPLPRAADLGCKPLRIGFAQAPVVALAGEEAERVELVLVHRFLLRVGAADAHVRETAASLRFAAEWAINSEQTAA